MERWVLTYDVRMTSSHFFFLSYLACPIAHTCLTIIIVLYFCFLFFLPVISYINLPLLFSCKIQYMLYIQCMYYTCYTQKRYCSHKTNYFPTIMIRHSCLFCCISRH